MNKILRNVFVAAMAMMSLSGMAQITFDASADKGTCDASNPGADQVTKDGVTIAVSNGAMNLTDQYRCYKSATFTVTSTVGNIQKVEISCTAEGEAKYGPGCFTDATAGSYAFEGKVGTWTGDASSFSMTASTNQVRINTVVVTVYRTRTCYWQFCRYCPSNLHRCRRYGYLRHLELHRDCR